MQNSLYTSNWNIDIYKLQTGECYGCQWDETVPESGGFSPDAAVPPARRQQTEQFVAGVMGVFCNLRAFFLSRPE